MATRPSRPSPSDRERPGAAPPRVLGSALREPVERLLAAATNTVRLLAHVTPRNAERERARLIGLFARGQLATPQWTYAPVDLEGTRRALEIVTKRLEEEGEPLALVYAARARELAQEAAVASAAGSPRLGALARARFASAPEVAVEAEALAHAWTREPPESPPASEEFLDSDAEVEGSLTQRLREEIGRRRLPFSVVVEPSLAALAATGERHIFVAKGRPTTRRDVERTVMHEIDAHALPRVRAASAPLGIFRFGTARGVDEQEGLALALEERHGFLCDGRARELGARHLAALAMNGGATFTDTTRWLMRELSLPAERAVLVAERVYRGSPDGAHAGLGREQIYIAAFVRVRRALALAPDREALLTSGQVGLDALSVLEPFAPSPSATW